MASTFIFLLVKFILLVPTTYAIIDCPNPPASTQLFFDLDALQSAQTNYGDIFQGPVQCVPEEDSCEQQICCGGDVGCCYSNPATNKEECGCKAMEDSTCGPPPLAYIKGSACDPHSKGSINMCVKKKQNGGWSNDDRVFISKNSDLYPEKEVRADSGQLSVDEDTSGTQVDGECEHEGNDKKATDFLDKFTAEMLMEKLKPHVLAKLFALEEAKRKKHGGS